MSNHKKNPAPFVPTELAVAVEPVRRRHQELIEAVTGWLAARDRPVDPDHLALICAGVEWTSSSDRDGTSRNHWTRQAVYPLLRCQIPNWCSGHMCLLPEELPEAMWAWFDALHGLGRMDPASDPIGELRKPLICYGGLDQYGRPRPPEEPSGLPCECALPYRETAELLFELVKQSEPGDPLDGLRRLVGRPVQRRDPWLDYPDGVDDDPFCPRR